MTIDKTSSLRDAGAGSWPRSVKGFVPGNLFEAAVVAMRASIALASLTFSMRHLVRMLALGMAVGMAAARAQSVDEIVCRARNADLRNEFLRMSYAYTRVQTTSEVDASGKPISKHSTRDDVRRLAGDVYLLRIEKDGKPVAAADADHDRQKFDQALKEYEDLPETVRQAKIAKALRDRTEITGAIANAFQFTLAGEEPVVGDPAWKLNFAPKADYQGKYSFLRSVRGVVWVRKKDYNWVSAKAETVDAIWFGFLLARFASGLEVSFENTSVDNEVWQPARIVFGNVSARFGLVKTFRGQREIVYDNHRKSPLKPITVPMEESCSLSRIIAPDPKSRSFENTLSKSLISGWRPSDGLPN
jgi:hypothetical protein